MSEIGRRSSRLEGILSAAQRGLHQAFGTGKRPRLFFAPGRVNLMGAHVDYNGGPVLPLAIDRGTWVLARTREEPVLGLASARDPESLCVTLGELPQEARGSWSDYPLGVVRQLLPLQRGAALGLELFFTGDLPIGAGLSSSASLCVATALAAASSWGIVQRPSDRARIAWLAERDFVGVPCGPMDPYAIALAEPDSVLWFECARTTYAHLVLDPGALSIAVVDSGVRRTLAESAYRDRVAECDRAFATLRAHQPGARCLAEVEERTLQRAAQELDEVSYRRAEHVISEVARTYAARRAIEAGRFDELGALMFETHESLRTLYEVSCEELDLVVEAARATDGVHGARLTGAGFGGCAAVLLRPGMEAVVGERLGTRFRARYGREPRIEYFACGGGPREFAVA